MIHCIRDSDSIVALILRNYDFRNSIGITRTSRDVCFHAAIGGIADIKRAWFDCIDYEYIA